jgi:hypothetical protein
MKIKSASAVNFAGYEKVTVSFDDNVTYLIGKNGAGKSTLGLSLIWFVLQGIAEKAQKGTQPIIGERFRFIGHSGPTAKGTLVLYDDAKDIEVTVTRKLTKTGTELSFQGPEGMTLDQAWLNDLFNLFLIAPKYFQNLNGVEQAKVLGIDVSKFDADLVDLKSKYTDINRELKIIGEVETVEPVERVDIEALKTQKEEIRTKLNKRYHENVEANKELRRKYEQDKEEAKEKVDNFNKEQDDRAQVYQQAMEAYNTLTTLGYEYEGPCPVLAFIESLPKTQPKLPYQQAEWWPAEPQYIDEMPDNKELLDIDEKLEKAYDTNRKADAYQQYLSDLEKRVAKESELNENLEAQKKVKENRIHYIQSFKFPFKDLSVDDEGQLLLKGKLIKEPYFSTGELLKIIPTLVSSSNPELKYVYIQDFNLLDEDMQADVIAHFEKKDFQLVIEKVGKEVVPDHNCILLKDNVVVSDGEETQDELI